MFFHKLHTAGLAINSFMVGDLNSKKCAVIDPVRDVAEYLSIVEKEQLAIVAIIETHVHADFISGARELKHALSNQPKIYSSGMGGAEWTAKYADVVVEEGEEVLLGDIRLRAVHTPGHTPEHTSWNLYDDRRSKEVPWLLFTGDFLFVGAVGRPDLLGSKEFKKLSHQLYHSVFDVLAVYEDFTEIYPSHGAGSLCGKSLASRASSTVGYEQKFNCALHPLPEEQWISNLMKDMPPSPPYFSRMKKNNVEGAAIVGDKFKNLKKKSAKEVHTLSLENAIILDTRSKESFASFHIPGSLNIPFSSNMSTWAGWILPYDTPIVLLAEENSHLRNVVAQLLCVGFDTIEGYLEGGISAWEAEGLSMGHIDTYSVDILVKQLKANAPLRVIDVRSREEWAEGHIPGAEHIPLGEIQSRVAAFNKDTEIAVICKSGYRASIAASILKKYECLHVTNVLGGMSAWYKENFPVEVN